MPNAHKLACSTKTNRITMAERVKEVGRAHGWGAITFQSDHRDPRRIALTLQREPYALNMSFDGTDRCGAFLGHWYTMDNKATYPKTFGFICRGSINEINYGKATTCVDTFEEFCDTIADGFKVLA